MTQEDNLIKNLQNGLAPELKMKLLLEYGNGRESTGFSKGFEDHTKTMKLAHDKRKACIDNKTNVLLDEVRDEIWKRKEELEKTK
jgi:hypothetical protein